jgi:hypothetical protein
MAVHALSERTRSRRSRLTLPVLGIGLVTAAALGFVAYVLWPTWPSKPVVLDAPALPITVAGVLFDVPPAAIRAAIQRHPGQQDRVDLAFDWPSLAPAKPDDKEKSPLNAENAVAAATAAEDKRLFVTIAALSATVLPPLERLRSIYPHYADDQASAGPDGLAILPFRAGTPYASEDLVYFGSHPDLFFARCTRPGRVVPGTCLQERMIDAAEITLRFPRDWLSDWRNVAGSFERLMVQLHPPASGSTGQSN